MIFLRRFKRYINHVYFKPASDDSDDNHNFGADLLTMRINHIKHFSIIYYKNYKNFWTYLTVNNVRLTITKHTALDFVVNYDSDGKESSAGYDGHILATGDDIFYILTYDSRKPNVYRYKIFLYMENTDLRAVPDLRAYLVKPDERMGF